MRRIERAASVFKQNGGTVEACVAMDMLREPRFDVGKVGTRQSLREIAEVLFHRRKHLRTVCAAERVGGEIAEAAARPMRILQAALRFCNLSQNQRVFPRAALRYFRRGFLPRGQQGNAFSDPNGG